MVSRTPFSSGQTHDDLRGSSSLKVAVYRCSCGDKAFASCMYALFKPNKATCKRPSQVASFETAPSLVPQGTQTDSFKTHYQQRRRQAKLKEAACASKASRSDKDPFRKSYRSEGRLTLLRVQWTACACLLCKICLQKDLCSQCIFEF